MKKFTVECDFGGSMSPFTIYIGFPRDDNHPIHFQAEWLSSERGGKVPQQVMDSLQKLHDLSKKNGVSFEDLCVYALSAAQDNDQSGDNDSGNPLGDDIAAAAAG